MTVNFIRHGKTAGNLEKRYIGRTDEPLCETGKAELKKISYPDCDIVISSPMKRCTETAELIYPSRRTVTYNDLRECDFGAFEGRNHIEMNGDPVYQEWLDKGGMAAFPGGEDSTVFRERCADCFLKAVRDNESTDTISFVVHGGTIMSVLEKLAVPHKEFYEYMTENGHGYITVFDGEKLRITGKI
ncbi:MAG: histidine phosphatase family protein [Ruminiclostridium sp.]|nr:histidine phosphatase family protein [Ruminiclostridium sp.]